MARLRQAYGGQPRTNTNGAENMNGADTHVRAPTAARESLAEGMGILRLLAATRIAFGATDRTQRDVLATMTALGFSASIAQLALMRELLAGFSGNELTIGVALSCWLVLTAAGTWLGTIIPACWRALFRQRRSETAAMERGALRILAAGTVAVALVAILEILVLRGGRDLLFQRGVSGDPIATIAVCGVVLAPFCLGSGALLALGCRALADCGDAAAIGRVYSADAAGSVVGAACFTFILSRTVDHIAALCWSATAVGLVAALVAWRRDDRWPGVATLTAAIALTLVAAFGKLDAISAQWQHHGQIVHRASSPYGRLVVTRDAGQLTFFENGAPVIYTANAGAVEELVHFALAQRPRARSVLVIGSAVAGAAREVLRYDNVRSVTAVELDPAIVAAGRALLPATIADPRITLVTGDGRRLVQGSKAKFDAILIGLPDPTTFQLNRFFTAEFFGAAKQALTTGGVLCLACGQYENFVSANLRQSVSSTWQTLATVFTHGAIIPGGRVFFLGSDAPLTRDIAGLLEQRGLHPTLVNRDYLDAVLTPDRLADIDRAAASAAPVNRDFHPILYFLRLKQWLAQYAFPAAGFAAVLVAILLVALVRLRAVPRMIFAAGFAGSTLEIVLLVALQAYFGSVYQQVGLIVAVFMAGLAVGAAFINHRRTQIDTHQDRKTDLCSSVFICGLQRLLSSPTAATERRPLEASTGAERRAPVSQAPASARRTPYVRLLGLAIAALGLLLALVLPHLGGISGPGGGVLGQAIIVTFTFALAAAMGAQFAFAAVASPSSGAPVAPMVFSADLVGAALGAAAVSTLLLPLYGVVGVCLMTAGLNLLGVGLSLRAHRDA